MTRTTLELLVRSVYLAQSAVDRQWDRVRAFVEGVTLGGLSPEGLTRLTSQLYALHGADDWRVDAGLNSWEGPWFEADLPEPPARILVGGAGKGREANLAREPSRSDGGQDRPQRHRSAHGPLPTAGADG